MKIVAEFCLKCFNEMFRERNKRDLTEKEVRLETDLCEGCGQVRPCVMEVRKRQKPFSIMDFF